MTLEQIAIGATVQLHAPAVGNPTVTVEAVTVDYTSTFYSTLATPLAHALVWVHEAARETRYPVDPKHLHPVKRTRG